MPNALGQLVGADVSEWQPPGSVRFAGLDFCIIRVSHGLTEDTAWREHLFACTAARTPTGFYHFLEPGPSAGEQADRFRGLCGSLPPEVARYAWWLDAEPYQGWEPSEGDVDTFRAEVRLSACGLYSTLGLFNGPLRGYLHFGLNWLALPSGAHLLPGWTMPDHVLTQLDQWDGIDVDVMGPAQPYPAAWAA